MPTDGEKAKRDEALRRAQAARRLSAEAYRRELQQLEEFLKRRNELQTWLNNIKR